MGMADIITEKLTRAFAPETLGVVDESAQHVGHAGHNGHGESHFRVTVVSSAFEGMSRLARQRAVHEALGHDVTSCIHAISLVLRTPSENGVQNDKNNY